MKNKERIMLIMDYLKENSNEQNKITGEKIVGYLIDKCGISVERKTIYNDIKTLNDLGYNIETTKQGYYWDGNIFEPTELRIMVDGIRASSFLSQKKTDIMIEKLSKLTNRFERKMITCGQYNNIKTANEQIYYNIFNIINAINKGQAITFKYFDLGIKKKKQYRKHDYKVFPLDILINQERYYMICYSKKYDRLNNYRIDKMESVEAVDEQVENIKFNVNEYMQQTFSMFTAKKTNVVLKCHSSLMDEIYTRFDKNVMIVDSLKDYYLLNVNVSPSQTFYGWLFSCGGKISIVEPQDLKDDFIQICKKMIELHQ